MRGGFFFIAFFPQCRKLERTKKTHIKFIGVKTSAPNQPEQKFISLAEFKASEESNGGFSGYANNFGVLDSYDDITLKGCFADSLQELIEAGFGAADHRWGIKEEIGVLENAFEDDTGLFVDVSYHPDPDSQKIRQKVNNRLAKGKKVGMSIGYYAVEREYITGEEAIPFLKNPSQEVLSYLKEQQPIVRLLKKCRVFEPSVVSMGANKASGVTEGKSLILDREQIQAERKQLISGASNTKKLQILNLKLRILSA